MPIPRRIFDTRIIGGLLQIPKAMIQNKREGGSQEPCSKNINQKHTPETIPLELSFIVFLHFCLSLCYVIE